MLQLLAQVEQALPELLTKDDWASLLVNDETPMVERVWRQLGENRICLHRIHPCYTPFMHKHPWPSAMRIIEGNYKMDIGYNITLLPPPVAATVILTPGSSYEMTDPDGWHSVNPIDTPTLSLMVIGKPWPNSNLLKRPSKLGQLSNETKLEIINLFKQLYK